MRPARDVVRRALEEGPHRRYYGVSDLGRELLGEWSGRWRSFVQAIDGLLAPHTEVLG